jgi:hypothetical protein
MGVACRVAEKKEETVRDCELNDRKTDVFPKMEEVKICCAVKLVILAVDAKNACVLTSGTLVNVDT